MSCDAYRKTRSERSKHRIFVNETDFQLSEADPHNMNRKFYMKNIEGNRHILEESLAERDLGVLINNRLCWSDQIRQIKARAYAELGKLRRTFIFWNVNTFKVLYCTFVRPYLEYCASVWSPINAYEIDEIESVQRNATKIVPELRSLHYLKRLNRLGISTLRNRRIRGDLIQYLKFYVGLCQISWIRPNPPRFALSSSGPAGSVRGSSHGVEGQFMRDCQQRDNFFSNRVVPFWNALPSEDIKSTDTNAFKNKLVSFLKTNKSFFSNLSTTVELR